MKGHKLLPEEPTVAMIAAALPHDDTFGPGFKARIYKEMYAAAPKVPAPVVPLVEEVYEALGKNQARTSPENVVDVLHALIETETRAAPQDGKLTVWYGSMPESNGKSNFTAILHRGDVSKGMTIDRSEYPDRVRYEADRVRWLIGELDREPWILDYDAEKHSGYRYPVSEDAITRVEQFVRIYRTRRGLDPNVIHGLDHDKELRCDDIMELVRAVRGE